MSDLPPMQRASEIKTLGNVPPEAPRVLPLLLPIGCLLWIFGALFSHGLQPDPLLYLSCTILLFAARSIYQRYHRKPLRPLWLAPGESKALASAKVASIVGFAALITGGVVEFSAPLGEHEPMPLWMRIAWHGCCAFGIAYVRFLDRFKHPPTRRPRS
ncbi:MAG: hypothetical protein EXS02_12325 [Planctomycetes bacterium]|nr:hypothetical protein [Planctomycetota bacterium]